MTEQTKRPWGKYKVVEKTKVITVKSNQRLSLQYHNLRDEFWKVLEGSGFVIIGEEKLPAKKGNTFIIPRKQKHRIEAGKEGIKIMEISTGEIDEEDITRIEDDYNRNKKIIVIASGYFDPLHIGHIEYLKLAKALGNKLVVILNNDKQCILKKGKSFMSQNERKIILESLKSVDEVFLSIDEDKSVCKSIEALAEKYKNHEVIFAKGGDRFSHEIPEARVCTKLGIKIVDNLGKKIQSSSNLIGLK